MLKFIYLEFYVLTPTHLQTFNYIRLDTLLVP
jgi:hypothetical protein